MNHIDEFTIHRFRGIRDLKLEKLGQINLLVGDNNSGKTSVLEALALFSDPLNFRTWFNVVNMREIAGGFYRLNLPDQLLWLFLQDQDDLAPVNHDILLLARGNIARETLSARYEKFSEIDAASAMYVLEDGSPRGAQRVLSQQLSA